MAEASGCSETQDSWQCKVLVGSVPALAFVSAATLAGKAHRVMARRLARGWRRRCKACQQPRPAVQRAVCCCPRLQPADHAVQHGRNLCSGAGPAAVAAAATPAEKLFLEARDAVVQH